MARRLEMPMTLFSFLWLVLVGAAIQRVAGPTYRGHELDITTHEVIVFAAVLAGLWLVVIGEFLLFVRGRDPGQSVWKHYRSELFGCICPALRIVTRSQAMDGRIWFPVLGWQKVNRELRSKLERFFSVPMIVVALLILPVLVVEYIWGDRFNQGEHVWALILLDSCTTVIWVAFTTEFIVMCAVAESKLAYCKAHWLDLAIILLPLISFARALRLARLSRLARLGRVSRVYRLRGLAFRAFRALLLVDVISRLIGRTPEKELRRLRALLAAKEVDLEYLRSDIAALETKLAATATASAAADPNSNAPGSTSMVAGGAPVPPVDAIPPRPVQS